MTNFSPAFSFVKPNYTNVSKLMWEWFTDANRLDIAALSWVGVWEVPLGSDSRLEGSHLRCTGLPAASGLCLPRVQSGWRRGKEEMKTVEEVRHESGGGERERRRGRLSLSPSALRPKTTLRLTFALAARLLSIFQGFFFFFFDSRFTVLVSSLAFFPRTLNNTV